MNNHTTHTAPRYRLCLWVLLWFGLLLASPFAVADPHASYGQGYVRLGQSWADGTPPDLPAPQTGAEDADEGAYLELVQRHEASGGPYSSELAEPLSSLGYYYRDRGKYAQALDLFQHALHVVRVNDGLFGEQQIPLVRALLDTYRMTGDMQALDDRYEYFFRLYGNGYPPFTPLRLRATLEFLRWQREALRLGLDGDRNRRLFDMYRLNERILKSASQSKHVTPEWYGQLVYSQVRNIYLLQSIILPGKELDAFRPSRSAYSTRSIHSNQEQELDFHQRRLEMIQRTATARGRTLLEGLLTRTTANGKAADLARVHLELGDWNHWNSNHGSAREEYSTVVQILQDSGDTRLLEEWLGSPVELPDNGAFWQPNSSAEGSRRVVLSADYRVTAHGHAKSIHIQAANPEDKVFTGRLRRKLAATLFRPRFAAGEAVAVEQVRRKYELVVR